MKMKWTLNELSAKAGEAFRFSGEQDFEQDLKSLSKEVLAASPVEIDGWIIVESESEIHVDAKINLNLTLPSSRSLESVDIKLDVAFQESYVSKDQPIDPEKYDSTNIVVELEDDYLDLSKPFVDSIVTSIPTQVFTKEERENNIMPEGQDWEVVSEDNYLERDGMEVNEKDSPFAALKDLFEEETEDEN